MHSLLEVEASIQEEQVESENTAGTSGQTSPPDRRKEDGDALKAKENLPLKEENDVSTKNVRWDIRECMEFVGSINIIAVSYIFAVVHLF